VGDPPRASSEWAESWQRSWDRLEELLVPERERQISALLDVAEAMAGPAPTVVDLACGPGTITCRLLDRLPRARSIAVDVDPVLLAIASATFADDVRVQVVRADLRDPGWGDALPESRVDAVLTATALHWLPPEAVRRLYHDLAGLLPRGGVVAHSERMPLTDLPRIGPALAVFEQRTGAGREDRRARWDAWWEQASREPALQSAVAQRHAVFETTYPTAEFSPPADWHITALEDAGFAEAGLIWRSGPAAVVAAVR
jgi:O-methyltransferase involved in polyketide biosynthesis